MDTSHEPTTNRDPDRSTASDARTVVALAGVYDADGTVLGELSYFVGARLGRAHCSLCDITHSLVRAKPAWNECRDALPIPFETFHRNDVPPPVRDAAGGALPTVVAALDDGTHRVLLAPDELDACGGSLDAMVGRLAEAAVAAGVVLDLGSAAPPPGP